MRRAFYARLAGDSLPSDGYARSFFVFCANAQMCTCPRKACPASGVSYQFFFARMPTSLPSDGYIPISTPISTPITCIRLYTRLYKRWYIRVYTPPIYAYIRRYTPIYAWSATA